MAKVKRGQVICDIEDLIFPVELIDNPRRTNSEYKKVVVGTLVDGEIDLNYCSARYELVPNSVIFPNIEKILKEHGIEFEVQYSHTNNARFYANYVITDKRYSYKIKGTNDEICPVLRVQHSYNGLTKYRIMFGYFRVICSNGLTVPVQEMSKYNLVIIGKHTSSILLSLKKLDIMLSTFSNEAIQITSEITAKYEMLVDRKVTNVKLRVEQVLKQNKVNMTDNKNFNTVENIASRIMREVNDPTLGYNGRVNDWLVYNGINQYLGDDNLNIAAPEKRMETDSKILEYMLKNAA